MPDPIEAWVDSAALRRMGELLVRSPRRGHAEGNAQDSLPGPPEVERAGRHLAHARALADRSGVLRPASESRPTVPQSTRAPLGPGPLLGRLTAFRDWLHGEVGVQGFFLLEASGEPIVDELSHEGLRQLALRLARSASQAGGLEPAAPGLQVQVSPESQLEVIPAETPLGFLILGLVSAHPLSANAAKIVADGLQKAVSPPATA